MIQMIRLNLKDFLDKFNIVDIKKHRFDSGNIIKCSCGNIATKWISERWFDEFLKDHMRLYFICSICYEKIQKNKFNKDS